MDTTWLRMAIVGVDACRSGWIAVAFRGEGVSAIYLKQIDDLEAAIPDAKVIGIGIPIGLPTTGRRLAYIEAKKTLGKRATKRGLRAFSWP